MITLSAALLAYQTLVNRRPRSRGAYIGANLAVTATLVALARWRGLTAAELGFVADPAGFRRGARIGMAAAGVLAALLAVPGGRRALRDRRTAGMTGQVLAWETLVRIPLGTVVLEEVAFRGVLPALWERRVGGEGAAVALSSTVFGLWHVPPTLRTLELNAVDRPAARAGALVGSCLVTGAAGVCLCRLRRQHGLVAPAVAHAAVNGLATIAAVIAHRLAE